MRPAHLHRMLANDTGWAALPGPRDARAAVASGADAPASGATRLLPPHRPAVRVVRDHRPQRAHLPNNRCAGRGHQFARRLAVREVGALRARRRERRLVEADHRRLPARERPSHRVEHACSRLAGSSGRALRRPPALSGALPGLGSRGIGRCAHRDPNVADGRCLGGDLRDPRGAAHHRVPADGQHHRPSLHADRDQPRVLVHGQRDLGRRPHRRPDRRDTRDARALPFRPRARRVRQAGIARRGGARRRRRRQHPCLLSEGARVRMIRLAVVVLCALVFVPAAAGARPLFGVPGDSHRFESLTGQDTQVGHTIVGWGEGATWGQKFARLFTTVGDIPMLGFGASVSGREAITPAQIAAGKGDAYLIAMNAAIAAWGKPMYVRPLGEMNGHWNVYCAFIKAGRAKPGHSTAEFKKTFARIYLIVHGGPAVVVNAKLHRLGLPPVAGDLPLNPAPLTKVIWNPQGYGAPDIPANRAQAYYPGDKFVDVVGNDLYDQGGGLDDPLFVLKMAAFVKTHRRVELISYFNSKPGSIFDLENKPRSRAAYLQAITPLG